MIKVKGLNWNKQREEHISRHNVSVEEFEDVAYGKHYGWFDPIAARDAVQNERRLYLRKMKR